MQSVAAKARTPLDPVNPRLETTFLSFGFGLTAPVFEHMDKPALLAREVQVDLAHRLIGKTAIHSNQVTLIESSISASTTEMWKSGYALWTAPSLPFS